MRKLWTSCGNNINEEADAAQESSLSRILDDDSSLMDEADYEYVPADENDFKTTRREISELNSLEK